jgi:cardiolipin hydrolase
MKNVSFLMLSLLVLTASTADAKSHRSKLTDAVADAAKSALTTAPKDNETCFAPDEPCAFKLIKFIQTAKESLDIAIFDITDRRVATAIIEQSKNARVRLVLNKRTKDTSGAYAMLKEAHLLARVGKQRGIMHNKFTIVDGKRLETGSYNYSYGAANSNQENQLYLSTPSVVESYKARFEKMWREGKTR